VHEPQERSPARIGKHPLAMTQHLVLARLRRASELGSDFGICLARESHVAHELQFLLRPARLNDRHVPLNLALRALEERRHFGHCVSDPPHQADRLDLPRLPRGLIRFYWTAATLDDCVAVLCDVLAPRVDGHYYGPYVYWARQHG